MIYKMIYHKLYECLAVGDSVGGLDGGEGRVGGLWFEGEIRDSVLLGGPG